MNPPGISPRLPRRVRFFQSRSPSYPSPKPGGLSVLNVPIPGTPPEPPERR